MFVSGRLGWGKVVMGVGVRSPSVIITHLPVGESIHTAITERYI